MAAWTQTITLTGPAGLGPLASGISDLATAAARITGLPAISVPCGFTPDGLPVGLQIVGRHNRDFEVLQLAHAFERATQFGDDGQHVLGGSTSSDAVYR